MSESLLWESDVARLVYALRQKEQGAATSPTGQTRLSHLLTVVDEQRRRELTPKVDSHVVIRLDALLRASSETLSLSSGAELYSECFTTLLRSLHLRRSLEVQICTLGTHASAVVVDGSERPGCDSSAGTAYHAKTDTRTVWIAETLLAHSARSVAILTTDGEERVRSLALQMVLHEVGHVYATLRRADFSRLVALYEEARAALGISVESVRHTDDDVEEFLAASFAYENARVLNLSLIN